MMYPSVPQKLDLVYKEKIVILYHSVVFVYVSSFNSPIKMDRVSQTFI